MSIIFYSVYMFCYRSTAQHSVYDSN